MISTVLSTPVAGVLLGRVFGDELVEKGTFAFAATQDAPEALEKPRRLPDVIAFEHGDDALEIVDHLKEPELLALMHDHEDRLLWMRRDELLRCQKLL